MKLRSVCARGSHRLSARSLATGVAAIVLLGLTACTPPVTGDGSTATVDPMAGCPMPADTAYDMVADPHSMYSTVRQDLKATHFWDRGYTGAGVTVAVIDTGIAPVDGLNSTNKVIHGPDLSFESQSPFAHLDGFGHGTHMSSIIAGRDRDFTGAVSGTPGTPGRANDYLNNTTKFLGVAPDATILSVKVGDHYGAADVTQVVAAINWIVEHKNDVTPPVRVLNLSYGVALDGFTNWRKDILSYAVDQAWRAGIVVVVPAGNDGQQKGTLLNSPGWNENVISVGAYDPATRQVSGFSSDSGYRRPDFVAPGQSIAALRVCGSAQDDAIAASSTADASYAGTRFVRGSGTSQAAAVTAGAAALMVQKNPCWSPNQIKSALRQSSVNLAGWSSPAAGQGALDLSKAYGETRACGDVPPAEGWAIGDATVDASRGPSGQLWDPSLYCTDTGDFLEETKTRLLAMFPGVDPAFFATAQCSAWGRVFAGQDGQILSGNRDIFGKPFDPAAHAAKTLVDRYTKTVTGAGAWTNATVVENGVTKTVEMWNGSVWTGSGFSFNTTLGAQAWNRAELSSPLWNGNHLKESSWNAGKWRADGWAAGKWRDDAWLAGKWRGDVWEAGKWRDEAWTAGKWRSEGWSAGKWRDASWS